MPRDAVEQFITALHELEAERRLDPLVALFSPEARIGNVLLDEDAQGQAGARSFWRLYRDSFESVRSLFDSVIVDGDKASLEWVSEGTKPGGSPFRYRGVTVLEFKDGLIVRFHGYFNPEALLAPTAVRPHRATLPR